MTSLFRGDSAIRTPIETGDSAFAPRSIDSGFKGDAISGTTNLGDAVSIFDGVTILEDEVLFLSDDAEDFDNAISGDADAAPNVKVWVLSTMPFCAN